MDALEEEEWCADQRVRVIEYLAAQPGAHGEVGQWPAWHVFPCVAMWAVESIVQPGWVGWWAISGDVPTDYIPCGPDRHPRAGMRDIARRWQEAARLRARGEEPVDFSIGPPTARSEWVPLLAARAEALLSFADDDALWRD